MPQYMNTMITQSTDFYIHKAMPLPILPAYPNQIHLHYKVKLPPFALVIQPCMNSITMKGVK